MKPSFEQALIEVWRQSLAENAKVVALGTERYYHEIHIRKERSRVGQTMRVSAR
jgi:hypothetical protein